MKRLAVLALLTFAASIPAGSATAGHDPDSVLTPGWSSKLEVGVGFTQSEFENYAKGGESSLTWASSAIFYLREYRPRRDWKNDLEMVFGQTRIGDGDVRKAADLLAFRSLHVWKLGHVVDPYASFSATTQLAKGYVYPSDDTSVLVSKFGNPLVLTQGAGGSRRLMPGLATRLGVSVTEYLVTDEEFAWVNKDGFSLRYTDDPETEKIEKSRIDTGIEWVTDYDGTWQKDKYKVRSVLRLFSKFEDPAKVDVSWLTRVSANVISIVNVNLETEVLYDEDILARTQFREIFSLGVSRTFR